MEDKLLEKVDEKIQHILDEDINTTNLEYLYKLSKIKHMTKEDKEMNYGGRRTGYDTYGDYDHYGRRGYDMKYRGHDYIDRMSDHYSRYEEGKRRYGDSEDTKRSLKYMLESMEDFARMLRDDAKSQEEVNMIRETAQRIANM